jgi:hypothetical protein
MRYFLTLLVALFATLGANSAHAVEVYVEDTIVQSGANQQDATTAGELVSNSVARTGRDHLTDDISKADVILQPRIMKLGDSYVLTVERRRGEEVVYASQVKAASLSDLDRAARRATVAALSGSASDYSRSATTETVEDRTVIINNTNAADEEVADYRLTRKGYQLTPGARPNGYWSIGIGPMIGKRMETDDVFYNLSVGRYWDIDPRASVKAIGEANFSTGDDSATLLNFGLGASWFFAADPNGSAYVTTDLGYGFATTADDEDADGFSFGAGVGYQFFRTRAAALDLQLRYLTILDEPDKGDGFPRMLGARLAVNF